MKTLEEIMQMFPYTEKEKWSQHSNGKGWVYITARVSPSAFVEGVVYGNARVYGDAQVYGDAWVFGNARVSGDVWKTSPLYIQGSRHSASNVKYGSIAIGCEVHTFAEWLEQYKAIGKAAGYNEEQIEEYKAIIDLFVKVGR